MIVVHVDVRVKPASIEPFVRATVENARHSLGEPGVARFDVLQSADDTAHFVLVEIYRSPGAVAAHKETSHYRIWRDTVAEMMVEPRVSTKFANVFPDDPLW